MSDPQRSTVGQKVPSGGRCIVLTGAVVAGCLLVPAVVLLLVVGRKPRPVCGPDIPSPDSVYYGGDVLLRDELLSGLLARLCIPREKASQAQTALAGTDFPFRQLRPGDSVTLTCKGLDLVGFTYHRNLVTSYDVVFDSAGAVASRHDKDVDTLSGTVCGVVKESFWNSLVALGEQPWLAMNFTQILEYDIDFFTESHDGDSFQIVVDRLMVEGRFFRYSRIQAVRYKGKAGNFYGFYYRAPSGHADYYNEKGQSLRKTVLRSPLQYAKVTSHFGNRFHPIHRIYRRHAGVDYGAPTGTPVSAIADGTVSYAGWRGGYGNFVELKHSGGLSSRYGHLSRYGAGVRTGRSVRQGQTVGYVGSTGVSTGPHLHFEIRKSGAPVNPLKVIPPRAEPVPAKHMDEFKRVKDEHLARIAEALNPPVVPTDSVR